LSFGQLLRQYRTAAGFSQEHLADLARLSVEAIGALERGTRRTPYRGTVALLAKALELNPEDRAKLEAAADGVRARPSRNSSEGQEAESKRRLPIQTTSLIGRQREVAEIIGMLDRSRLVTITGSGGVGKTRVTLEVASLAVSNDRPDIRFVDLSQISDGTLVAEPVAAALGRTSDQAASIEALVRALSSAQALLVLDNCEHLIADVAHLVSTLLRTCPGIAFLTASRERLAVQGEAVYRLPSLGLPTDRPPDLDRARHYDAIELFVQRATAIDHTIAFSDQDVGDICEICSRLDGIPLALELAAARVTLLGLAELRERIGEGLALTGGPRNLPARQQTMRATITWSYDLLNIDERRVLDRVSIFAGGFSLSAAEAVCAAGDIATDSIADILASLVDKSLVNVSRFEKAARFTLLDSVRSFALERLHDADAVAIFRERHARWIAEFADWVDASRAEFPEFRLRSEVDPELENARAAIAWALEQKSDAGTVVAGRIVGGLRTIWLTSGRRSECRRFSTIVLENIDEQRYPSVVAPLLRVLVQTSDGAEILALAERATAAFERIGDRLGIAVLQSHVAKVLRRRGFIDEAEVAIGKAGAIFATGDLPRLMQYTSFLHHRLEIRSDQRRYTEALADYEEGLGILRSLGDHDALDWQMLRAEIESKMGNFDAAIDIADATIQLATKQPKLYARLLSEAYPNLAIWHILAGNFDAAYSAGCEALRRSMGTSANDSARLIGILAMANLAAVRGQAPRAALLSGALDAYADMPSLDGSFPGDPVFDQCRALLDETLGDILETGDIERLQLEGRSLSIDMAMAEASKVLDASAR
jgi:predicted ATPase/DNA-binding XRE family transcriptional regulator